MKWLFRTSDGREWVIAAHTKTAAQAAAHVFEKRRTGSIAAGMVAAGTVTRY